MILLGLEYTNVAKISTAVHYVLVHNLRLSKRLQTSNSFNKSAILNKCINIIVYNRNIYCLAIHNL